MLMRSLSSGIVRRVLGVGLTAPKTGLPAIVNISDTFPEADSTNLNGLRPEITNINKNWESAFGTFQINTNAVRSTSDANTDCFMILCGTNGTYQIGLTGSYGAANDRDPAFLICGFDKDNHIIAWPRQTTLFLTKMNMGTLAGLTSGAISNAVSGTSYPEKVIRNGNQLDIYFNGASSPTFSYTLTGADTKFANYPYAGGYLTKLGTGGVQFASWDNFSAVCPSAGLKIPLIMFDGDSLTIGVTLPETSSYPYQTLQLLNNPSGICWVNKGVNGQTIAQMLANVGTKITNKISGFRQKNVVIVWGGSNDITSLVDPTTVYNNTVSECQAIRAAGGQAIDSTILTRTDMNATAQTNRAALNTMKRNNWQTYCDGLIDDDADPNLQDFNNATYFLADKVHLTQVGYGLRAARAKTVLNNIGIY